MSDSPQPVNSNGFGLFVGAVVLFGIIYQCSSSKPTPSPTQSSTAPTATTPSIEYPKVSPLDTLSMRVASSHYRAVFAAAGLPGAVVYSQNCYAAVASAFSWAKLDRCGAFDMMSAEALLQAAQDPSGNATTYFDSETAAARYMAVASKAGDTPDDVDVRVSAFQTHAKAALIVKKKPLKKIIPEPPKDTDDTLPLDDAAEAVAGITNDAMTNTE
jgi:hypothetical protein